MAHIESVSIKGNKLIAVTPCFSDNGDYDEYPLYEDDNKEHLEKALDCLFDALTDENINGCDCSVTHWEEEKNVVESD
jgi:hypothetical protein